MDTVTRERRTEIMSLVRSKNTLPELTVRRLLHRMGHRFRLHRRDLPGHPDIVLPRHRLVVFVHGCFWHRHRGCPNTRTPNTRREFWLKKFADNVRRDHRARRALKTSGWAVLVVWECETRDLDRLRIRIADFMEDLNDAIH
jgi:DNA mismatch endonuclease (patch repair protein)